MSFYSLGYAGRFAPYKVPSHEQNVSPRQLTKTDTVEPPYSAFNVQPQRVRGFYRVANMQWPLDDLHWPMGKVVRNMARMLEMAASAPPIASCAAPVVLLTTGALNPIHRGHVSMIHIAAEYLRSNVATVGLWPVGGFVSPSHDLYLAQKFAASRSVGSGSGAATYFPSHLRIAMAELACREDALVSTGTWETCVPTRWPDFPEVCGELERTLERMRARGLLATLPQVWYVCGDDHAAKCGLSEAGGRGVSPTVGVLCVARGQDAATSPSSMLTTRGSRFLRVATTADIRETSSSLVRKLLEAASQAATPAARSAALDALHVILHADVAVFLLSRMPGATSSRVA